MPPSSTPIGAKGGGESGPPGALPAVINAVVDALKPLGVTHFDMPATPERVWQAIRDARAGTATAAKAAVAPAGFDPRTGG